MLGDLFANFALGMAVAFTPTNLYYCFLGVFLGTLLGVIPGIGALVAISLLFPFTYYIEPGAALIMLAGIYYGTSYGGSTASILLNVAGTPSSAVVCLDGYPMAQQGRAGPALLMTALASFVGGSVGILLIMFFGPMIAILALRFGAQEYFSLMVLGLAAACTMSGDSVTKGMAMVVVGILIGLIGIEATTNVTRFTFGAIELYDGVGMVPVVMGLFGVASVIASISEHRGGAGRMTKVTLRSMIPSRDDVDRFWGAALRGSGIGAFFGILPGAGGTIASFASYAVEKRTAREPGRFGKGAIEGIVGPESSNNAADQAAFIPTLTLGIPGSATMAILLGVMIIHGVNPGPRLVIEHPNVFWGLIMSFWIGNIMLLVLNIPMIGLWVRILQIPYHLFYPAILMFVCMGVYSVNGSIADVWMTVIIGAIGYLLILARYPLAPLLLGYVLGPMMEENFRRSLVLSRGNLMTFFERPISSSLLVLTILIIGWTVWSSLRPRPLRVAGTP